MNFHKTIERHGYAAVPGVNWRNTCACYAAFPDDAADVVAGRLRNAQEEIVALIEKNFSEQCGDARQEDYVLVVLEGWWMKATKVPAPLTKAQNCTMLDTSEPPRAPGFFVDCTYAFVHKDDPGLDGPPVEIDPDPWEGVPCPQLVKPSGAI